MKEERGNSDKNTENRNYSSFEFQHFSISFSLVWTEWHTGNLNYSPMCSIYIQSPCLPAPHNYFYTAISLELVAA